MLRHGGMPSAQVTIQVLVFFVINSAMRKNFDTKSQEIVEIYLFVYLPSQ